MEREIKIGEWRFRPALHQLEGPGGVLPLEPRTADVLNDLARHAGQVRSRNELLDVVWGDAFVGDAVLTHCIWQLRKAFGDDARRPQYIKTVPSRGYRLIATTQAQHAPAVRTLVAVEPFARVSMAAQVAAAVAAQRSAALTEQSGVDRPGVDRPDADPRLALLTEHDGTVVSSADGLLIAFQRPVQAVRFALALHHVTEPATGSASNLEFESGRRIGIHMDEVRLRSVTAMDTGEVLEVDGAATGLVARLRVLAMPGQILLTGGVFDVARRATAGGATADQLEWRAHGLYELAGLGEPLCLFEVGVAGEAPLSPPPDSERARRGLGDGTIPGWRPAPGQQVPTRSQWRLEARLGEGGFGEVWLAAHAKTHEKRVFKFCYDALRLRALQREVTIFRLIKEELGARPDIGRVLDWNFETAPYFLELEYSEEGSLVDWIAARGGLSAIPLADRLRLVREAAEALAAAHSVGVLHKDIKPSNLLIYIDGEGEPHTRLTDFGVGRLTDQERLARAGVTALGMTQTADTLARGMETGTHLYMAPELVEGHSATVQADIYALGVVLYQMTVGDLGRALGSGWERGVDDALLREDIAAAVDGASERRLTSALELASRLAGHARRRAERIDAERLAAVRARDRRWRRWLLLGAGVLAIVVAILSIATIRVSREAARANEEARTAQQVATFLGDLFRDAEPGEDLGRTFTARELLDLGTRKALDELEDQPLIQAELLTTIGIAYRRLGALDDAGTVLERALMLRHRHVGDDSLPVAETRHALAGLRTDQGRWDDADGHARAALAIRRKGLDDGHPLIAESLDGLAWLLRIQGAPEAAEPLYREALAMRRAHHGDRSLNVASSVSNLALSLRARGQLDAAEPLYREALAIRQALLGERHLRTAESLNNLGGLLRSRGDADAAVPLLRRALDIRREHLGDQHPDVATGINNLARALRATGQLDEALGLYERALEQRRSLLGAEHPRVGQTLTYLAEVHLDRDDASRAEQTAHEALAVLDGRLEADHWRMAYARSILGGALTDQGRFAEAEPLLLASHEVLRARRGDASVVAREARQRIDQLYSAWGRRR